MDMQLLLFNPLTAVLAGYLFVAIALTAIAQPMRRTMVDLAEELMLDPHLTKEDRDYVQKLIDRSMSFHVALVLPVAIVASTAEAILNPPAAMRSGVSDRLRGHPSFHRVLVRYFASILATNPILAVFSIVLMGLTLILEIIFCRNHSHMRETMEAPVMRAASSRRRQRLSI